MSLRLRLLLAFIVLVLVSVGGLGLGVRHEMRERLTAEYVQRIDSRADAILTALEQDSEELAVRLQAVRDEIARDNRFRLAVVDRLPEERPYLLEVAGRYMQLMGLSMLQIQDDTGAVISSGHFRNAYDRLEGALPRKLAAAPGGIALTRARTPEGTVLVFARADSVRVGLRTYTLVGGISAQRRLFDGLADDDELSVSLLFAGTVRSTDRVLQQLLGADPPPDSTGLRAAGYVAREVSVPYVTVGDDNSATLGSARLIVTHHLRPLNQLYGRLQVWILIALGLTAGVGLLLAVWLSDRLSRPIQELVEKTSSLDLDQLDVEFPVERRDEVGVLARFLAGMTQSLKTSVGQLRDAERRATLGDVARQVNHDVKNGLIPIRNVLRHMDEVSRENPEAFLELYRTRRRTLESSLSYLERLAENYARISPVTRRQPTQVNPVLRQVASAARGGNAVVETQLAKNPPPILADPVALRRIVENLVRNAIQSLPQDGGRVTLTSECVTTDGGDGVRLCIEDNGAGIPEEALERVFDDFFSTRERGVGLGLSIVRRLVADSDGTIRVESIVGRGTRFLLDFPAYADTRNGHAAREEVRS